MYGEYDEHWEEADREWVERMGDEDPERDDFGDVMGDAELGELPPGCFE